MIHSRDVKFNELVCGVEKESLADTPAEKPRVVIEPSHSSIDDSSSEEVEEQRVNSEESDTEPEERTESTVR